MQELNIRSALPKDAKRISNLIKSVSSFSTVHPDGEGAEGFFKTISPKAIEAYITSPRFNYLVGLVGEELAGVVAVRDNSHLFHLFVARQFHRRGVALKLWETAKAAAMAAGNQEGFTVFSTLYAVPVYERFGFQVTGPKVEKDGIAFIPLRLSLEKEKD